MKRLRNVKRDGLELKAALSLSISQILNEELLDSEFVGHWQSHQHFGGSARTGTE